MALTEKEAKEKWCPMVRITVLPDTRAGMSNRGETKKGSAACIASNCMMWRWERGTPADPEAQKHYNIKGYCGLAGNLSQ